MPEFQGPDPSVVMDSIQQQADSMPAPTEATPSPPQQASSQVAEAPAQQSAPQPVDDGEEFEYGGQRVKLTRAERDYLFRFGLDAYREASTRMETGGQPADANSPPQGNTPRVDQAPQTDLQKVIREEVAKATQDLRQAAEKVNTWERKAEIQTVMREADEAISKDPILSDLATNGTPEDKRLLQAFTIYAHSLAPNANWSQITGKVSALFKTQAERAKADFVKSKVEQSQRRVEGSGGAVPSNQGKPFTKADFMNGRLEDAAKDMLDAALRS